MRVLPPVPFRSCVSPCLPLIDGGGRAVALRIFFFFYIWSGSLVRCVQLSPQNRVDRLSILSWNIFQTASRSVRDIYDSVPSLTREWEGGRGGRGKEKY